MYMFTETIVDTLSSPSYDGLEFGEGDEDV